MVRASLLALAVLAGCASSGSGSSGPGSSPPATAPPPSDTSPLQGKAAPDFSRPALDGHRFALAEARGRVSIVKFVAKYCVPCQRTLPAIEHLHREHPDVVVVAVAEDESEDDARELVATHHLTFPVVHDREGVLRGRYRVSDLPVTFVVDRAGTVRWVGGAAASETDIVNAIRAMP